MLARIWRTRFVEDRLEDLVRFANEESLPVLSGRPGCGGVEFLRHGDEWLTITYWDDDAAIAAAERAADYAAIVDKIQAQGFLVGHSETTVHEVRGRDAERITADRA